MPEATDVSGNIVAPSSWFSQGDSLTRQVAVGVSEDTTSNFSVALVTVACHRHGVEVIDGSIYLLTLMGSCLVVTLSSAYVVACLCRALTEYVIFRAEMAVVGRKVRQSSNMVEPCFSNCGALDTLGPLDDDEESRT